MNGFLSSRMYRKLSGVFLFGLLFLFFLPVAARKASRPNLLMTPERIAAAKRRVVADTAYQSAWATLKGEADQSLASNDIYKVEVLSLAYLMTDSAKYSDAVVRLLEQAARAESWGVGEMLARTPAWNSELKLAEKAFLCAIGYDAVYPLLSARQRGELAAAFDRLALEPLMGDWLCEPTRIHSLNSMGHNWWTSCAGMGGILALALARELPHAADMADRLHGQLPQWFAFAGDVLQNKPRSFDRAGGMYESLNYASFGIYQALLFMKAWENAHSGQSFGRIPQLENLADYMTGVCYPRSGILYSLNFGDSHKNITAGACAVMLIALGYDDPALLWYLKNETPRQHRQGLYPDMPLGFLYCPDTGSAPPVPAKPTSLLLADFGWATMRNSWEKDETMLAVKCGHTWNHAHADAGSLILFHKGVDIIKDAGNCSYGKPDYRNYFFQSEAHNVVLFNGEGQPRDQQYCGSMLDGTVSDLLDGGTIKYVLANATGPYAKNFTRNFRSFLWMDDVIYVIDDMATYQSGQFSWVWHPNGTVRKNGADIDIANGASAVAIRPLYPRMLALSNFVHDYPDDLYWEIVQAPTEDLNGEEEYWKIHLPETTDRVKAVTAIILKEHVGQREMPQITRREGRGWIGLRVKFRGKVTDIYINQLADGRLMHSNSWVSADGWLTDAYLWAVRYPDGESPVGENTDFFLSYGSALRRQKHPGSSEAVQVDGEDATYFSSLAKLSFVMTHDGGVSQVWMNGQPLLDAFFNQTLLPGSLTVNNRPFKGDKSVEGFVRIQINATPNNK